MTFKTWAELEKYIKTACREAVDETTAYFLEILRIHIEDDFYVQVNPKKYRRSYQFYSSAVMQMVQGKANEVLGKIYMNPDLMQRKEMGGGIVAYKPPFDGHEQLKQANEGIHGGFYETGISYWKNFLEEFDKKVEGVLLDSLADHGLPIRKA